MPARVKSLLATAGPAGFALLAVSCSGALDPKGQQASRIADLTWALLGLSVFVFVLFMAVLAWALFRRPGADDNTGRDRALIIGGGGLVLPSIVLVSVIGLTVDALDDLTPQASEGALEIEIVGHDWWWDVSYPEAGVRTANEIHIPVGETVSVTGTSADVIHSFWAPQVNGKMDLVPGKSNTFKLRADEPGTYRGQCAEFCGIAHGKMAFHLVAQPRDEFEQWLQSQRATPEGLTASRTQAGREVFFNAGCSICHGLSAEPDGQRLTAPDLLHLAGREWFASGTRRVNEENLTAWIRDPDSIKPGVNMPGFEQLTDQEVADLVTFLLSLE